MRRFLITAFVILLILGTFAAYGEEEPALILPSALIEIKERAFAGVGAKRVVIPEGATSIGSEAFAECKDLVYVEIPESVVHIAADAFAGSEKIILLCPAGSTAAFCAELYGIPWQDSGAGDEVLVESIVLDRDALQMEVGGSALLAAQVFPENAANTDIIWTSSDPNVACVDAGVVQAVAPGMAVVTAAAADGSGTEASCTVQVDAQAGTISFSGANSGASSTNAYMYIKATAPKSGKFTAMGIRLWDAQGRLYADYEKELTGSAKTSMQVWFGVFGDSGIALQPDSSYTYQMYVKFAGETCWTGFSSVTTLPEFSLEAVPDKDEMVANLQNCTDKNVISSSKKLAMVTMAEALLDAGYEPAYVAGVLSNIYHEGTFGKFESSKYSSNEPAYLVYMDENYDYRNKYSNKLIYNGISLSEVSAMLDELAEAGFPGKFGLGSVQWTGGRTRNLMKMYMEEAGESDTITLDQVIAAEVKMIKSELAGSYKYIRSRWMETYGEAPVSDDAAFSAGYRVCVSYEVPASYRSKAVDRGVKAVDIYKVMLGLK